MDQRSFKTPQEIRRYEWWWADGWDKQKRTYAFIALDATISEAACTIFKQPWVLHKNSSHLINLQWTCSKVARDWAGHWKWDGSEKWSDDWHGSACKYSCWVYKQDCEALHAW